MFIKGNSPDGPVGHDQAKGVAVGPRCLEMVETVVNAGDHRARGGRSTAGVSAPQADADAEPAPVVVLLAQKIKKRHDSNQTIESLEVILTLVPCNKIANYSHESYRRIL